VIATARADQAERMRALGARETVDHTRAPVVDQLRATHPTGVDALIDLVSDAAAFSAMTSIVRCRGAVATTVHAADAHALRSRELRGGNFELNASAGLLHVLSEAIDAGYLCVPIGAMVPLAEAPAAIAESRAGHAHGKTVILI
jgi:NADPH:quinone reductase-like Zn-dependent oxidoreductase